jgi:PIN domain nuclease of toxin-antitoxin system
VAASFWANQLACGLRKRWPIPLRQSIRLSPQIAIESHALPDEFHRDPADQLIVATARVTNATLMTRDRRILDYAARGHLTAIAA